MVPLAELGAMSALLLCARNRNTTRISLKPTSVHDRDIFLTGFHSLRYRSTILVIFTFLLSSFLNSVESLRHGRK
jgi:hypothetical protein